MSHRQIFMLQTFLLCRLKATEAQRKIRLTWSLTITVMLRESQQHIGNGKRGTARNLIDVSF